MQNYNDNSIKIGVKFSSATMIWTFVLNGKRKMELGVHSSYCPAEINLLYSVGAGNSALGGLGRWLRVQRRGMMVSGCWHTPPSWKELLKFQIFTPNTVHLRLCYPETCVFIQGIQIGQESEEEMERTVNVKLHVMLAALCLPSQETAIMRRWEGAPRVSSHSPVECQCIS